MTASLNDISYLPPDISSYDILLRKHQDSHVEIMSFSHHIGNRRFQIFLDIYQDSYNAALLKNDLEECERITGAIAHTICHSCIPRGRFLEQDNMTGWCDLGDGAITRERIRRGFLGLLFTLPIQTRSVPTHLHPKPQKKEAHVNLADARFVVKDIPSKDNVPHTEIKGKDEENDMSDSDSDTFDEIVSHEISYDISEIHTPTMMSKSFIRSDDVLFYGENADILFNFDHVGNNRLRHLLTQKSKTCSFDNQGVKQFVEYASELVKDFMRAYPNTRFLRQQNHTSIDMWIQMDVETAILKMSSSLFYASKYFSTESDVEKPSNMNCNKRFKSESTQGSINSASSMNQCLLQPKTNRSKAA